MNSKYGTYTTKKHKLTKKHEFDAGLDICSNEDTVIEPHSNKLVSTGISLHVPDTYVGLLWSRSGLSAKYGIEVGAGCIDSNYRGEVKVLLYNHSDKSFIVNDGDRIAQLLTIPIMLSEYIEVEELDDTTRGSNGFGSTGV